MATENDTLTIFRDDLPDPESDLYLQRLNTFTLFPKLPIELRLMILRATFKARKVAVKPRCHYISETREPYLKYTCRNPAPIILVINQESRAFGLKHYRAFIKDTRKPDCKTYINPKIDTLTLVRFEYLRLYPFSLFKSIGGSIQKIEWRSAVWTWPLTRADAIPPNPTYLSTKGALLGLIKSSRFKGLRTLYIEGAQYRGGRKMSEQERIEGIQIIRGFFETMAKETPGLSIPEVILL